METKSWLVAKLKADAALMAAIRGNAHLLPTHPGVIAEFPTLIYSETCRQAGYFDNAPTAIELTYVFDIYTADASTTPIYVALVAAMTGLGFNLDLALDVPDADASIAHKNCRFRRLVRAEDLV